MVINSIRVNSLDRDIASIGVKTFAQMPTTGMGHSLAGSVITQPPSRFFQVVLGISVGAAWQVIIFGLILKKVHGRFYDSIVAVCFLPQ